MLLCRRAARIQRSALSLYAGPPGRSRSAASRQLATTSGRAHTRSGSRAHNDGWQFGVRRAAAVGAAAAGVGVGMAAVVSMRASEPRCDFVEPLAGDVISVYGECCADGKPHGHGRYTHTLSKPGHGGTHYKQYEGGFRDGVRSGQGLLTHFKSKRDLERGDPWLRLNGTFANNFPNGWCALELPGDGLVYEGEWVKGKRKGFGMQKDRNGIYFGNWEDGKRTTHVGPNFDGLAVLKFADGDAYYGHFKNDYHHGPGLYMWHDGSTFMGNWVSGERAGMGTLFSPRNQVIYEGEWQHNQPDGVGKRNYHDGGYYQGAFRAGRRHGNFGKHVFSNGTEVSGEWENDNLVSNAEYNMDDPDGIGGCLVVSLERYDDDRLFRRGGREDRERVVKVFKKMGYRVTCAVSPRREERGKAVAGADATHDVRTAQDIVDVVDGFSADVCGASAVVVVMGHGVGHHLVAPDNTAVDIAADITHKLSGAACKQMAQKPKLVVVNACRDSAAPVSDGQGAGAAPAAGVALHTLNPSPTSGIDAVQAARDMIPNDCDFAVWASTPLGYGSWRNRDGSYFVRALAKVLHEQAHFCELRELGAEVNKQAGKLAGLKGKAQVPVVATSMWKKMRFPVELKQMRA